jgi:hypothetical protein
MPVLRSSNNSSTLNISLLQVHEGEEKEEERAGSKENSLICVTKI